MFCRCLTSGVSRTVCCLNELCHLLSLIPLKGEHLSSGFNISCVKKFTERQNQTFLYVRFLLNFFLRDVDKCLCVIVNNKLKFLNVQNVYYFSFTKTFALKCGIGTTMNMTSFQTIPEYRLEGNCWIEKILWEGNCPDTNLTMCFNALKSEAMKVVYVNVCCRDAANQTTVFSMLHPLDEVAPVIIKQGGQQYINPLHAITPII